MFEIRTRTGTVLLQLLTTILILPYLFPLPRPIAAAILIFTLVAAWNDYLFPLVFLQSPELQTITLVPQYFVGEFSNDQTKILASAVITAIPEIVAELS